MKEVRPVKKEEEMNREIRMEETWVQVQWAKLIVQNTRLSMMPEVFKELKPSIASRTMLKMILSPSDQDWGRQKMIIEIKEMILKAEWTIRQKSTPKTQTKTTIRPCSSTQIGTKSIFTNFTDSVRTKKNL